MDRRGGKWGDRPATCCIVVVSGQVSFRRLLLISCVQFTFSAGTASNWSLTWQYLFLSCTCSFYGDLSRWVGTVLCLSAFPSLFPALLLMAWSFIVDFLLPSNLLQICHKTDPEQHLVFHLMHNVPLKP